MLQLLVIETDPDLRVARALRRLGYSVTTERPEADAEKLIACEPDVVVVDCTASLTFGRYLPSLRERIGVDRIAYLVLLLPDDVPAAGKSSFSGDFVVCGSDGELPSEALAARARRLARAHAPHKATSAIQVGELIIDREGYEVRRDGELVELTYQEFLLLSFLAANRGKVFTREQLLNRVWGYDYFGGTRTVDIHIRRIRAKLAPSHDRYIQTIRQVGYKFAQEVRP